MSTTQILLVEDNPTDVFLLKDSFSRATDWQTELKFMDDGEKAINYLATADSKPDLAILDLNLPNRTGLEVLEAIRADQRLANLPVIIFSSYPEDAIKAKARLAHLTANCYITKPSALDVFLGIAERFRKCYEKDRDSDAKV